jgi:hypothetical protein
MRYGVLVAGTTALAMMGGTAAAAPPRATGVSARAGVNTTLGGLPRGERNAIVAGMAQRDPKVRAADGAAGDLFGESVSVSDNTVVVGAPDAAVNGDGGQGAVYVFAVYGRHNSAAREVAKLTASDGAAGDGLGSSVSIADGTVVAGAPYATVAGNALQGAVYVFREARSGWATATESQKLTASDGVAGDNLGTSVAIAHRTVAAGAPSAMVGDNSGQGAVYVYKSVRTGPAATETAKLTASDGAAGDGLGTSVALSHDTVVSGAPQATVSGNPQQGAVYAFVPGGGGWVSATQTAKLTASLGNGGDLLGSSVSIDGRTVVAGAPQATIGDNAGQGAAYVFVAPKTGWSDSAETAQLTASDGSVADGFATSVAVSGPVILAGAPTATVGTNSAQGAVYAFVKPRRAWATTTETTKLTSPDGAASDEFGESVALAGNLGAAGAPGATINGNAAQGAAYFAGTN